MSEKISENEKKIYNTYLRISRTAAGGLFRYRENFSNMDSADVLSLKKIGNLLYKYPHIHLEDYIRAPYLVYPETNNFYLSFYADMGGVKAYTLYMNQLQETDPDDERQLEFFKKSLKHIGSFLIKNKISYQQYPTFKKGATYEWMKQVKRREISIYALMEFKDINDIIYNTPDDEREMFLGSSGRDFLLYKGRYLKSKKAIFLIREGMEIIKKINTQLTLEK